MSRRRAILTLVAAALAASCSAASPAIDESASGATPPSPRPSPSASRSLQEGSGPVGPSASRALAKLCPHRRLGGSQAPAEASAPAIVTKVESQVEDIRELDFTRRVPVDAVTHEELVHGLEQTFDSSFPAELLHRRSLAWATIGAIPPGTEIRGELEAFAGTRVIGYYDEVSKYLVFLGSDDPTPVQLVTLAHELTHALDDQHFGLMRLDELASDCEDEGFQAALALAEGDATYVMIAYAQRYLTLEEQLRMAEDSGSMADDIAPFIVRLQTWPYTAGMGFVQSLVADGGERAVDAAFRHPPVSTEQIIDPSAYPEDAPVPVDVPQLAPRLGGDWRDLDVQITGASWLSILLGLRIDQARAEAAVEGWEGGIYRAWSDGNDVAVVLRTTWNGHDAASRFAQAMDDWLTNTDAFSEVRALADGSVTVLFGSNEQTLDALRSAA
jgi:hypothetical protein